MMKDHLLEWLGRNGYPATPIVLITPGGAFHLGDACKSSTTEAILLIGTTPAENPRTP